MERKEYQTKLSDSYYSNEDELREIQPVLNCHSVNQNILEQREYLSDNIYLLHSDTLEVDLLQ